MPTVRPFRFQGLRRYSRQAVALEQSVAAFLARGPLGPGVAAQIGDDLGRYLKASVKISGPELSYLPRSGLGELLPDQPCLVVIGVGPSPHKVLLELDRGVAALVIDRLLGGRGEINTVRRRLTEIEQGVLSFVILRVVALLNEGFQGGLRLALNLDRFVSSVEELGESLAEVETLHVLGFRLGVGERAGYARVLFPDALVTERFGAPISQGPSTDEELDHMRGNLAVMGEQEVEARVEVATLDLSPDDVASIEVGDIIVLENHAMRLTPGGIEGEAFVRIGDGRNGGLRGRLINHGEMAKLEINEIVVQEEPTQEPAEEYHG